MSVIAGFFGWQAGRAMFCSVGMLMIFQAFLQTINFSGGWPADQPADSMEDTNSKLRPASARFDLLAIQIEHNEAMVQEVQGARPKT